MGCHANLVENPAEHGMAIEDEFFEQAHPFIVEVIGTAVIELLAEQKEVSKASIVEMIQVLFQGEDADLAVELAIDILTLPYDGNVKG